MNILAIESSCDETSVAIVKDGSTILNNVVASSTSMHEKWGGIVPEVAAREQLTSMLPVLQEALSIFSDKTTTVYSTIHDSIDAIAIAIGPGLIGSLLIGVESAKTISFLTHKPIIPVNHVLAHMYANVFSTQNALTFPAISLVVSGGHTELFLMNSLKELTWLGGTIDDAAGEAFDKTARLLGFGSKGGVAIQDAAKKHTLSSSISSIQLPRAMMHEQPSSFSFSGFKTAVLRAWNTIQDKTEANTMAFAYEIQEAITDVLVAKTLNAATSHNASSILISGGVSANIRLREKFSEEILKHHIPATFHCPPIELCTDNASYIGAYAYFRGIPVDWHTIQAVPNLSVEE